MYIIKIRKVIEYDMDYSAVDRILFRQLLETKFTISINLNKEDKNIFILARCM